jgi:hypothetical protein
MSVRSIEFEEAQAAGRALYGWPETFRRGRRVALASSGKCEKGRVSPTFDSASSSGRTSVVMDREALVPYAA